VSMHVCGGGCEVATDRNGRARNRRHLLPRQHRQFARQAAEFIEIAGRNNKNRMAVRPSIHNQTESGRSSVVCSFVCLCLACLCLCRLFPLDAGRGPSIGAQE
jgi:hypothetical protein